MSIESTKALIERIKTDEDFAEKVGECKDADARMAFVRAAGYEFTQEEIAGAQGELTDDELQQVAGGVHACFNWTNHFM